MRARQRARFAAQLGADEEVAFRRRPDFVGKEAAASRQVRLDLLVALGLQQGQVGVGELRIQFSQHAPGGIAVHRRGELRLRRVQGRFQPGRRDRDAGLWMDLGNGLADELHVLPQLRGRQQRLVCMRGRVGGASQHADGQEADELSHGSLRVMKTAIV